tara:strand:+ start:24 stop:1154 length:1131 start_codon:yes stop_codon:yes gene_type:complete
MERKSKNFKNPKQIYEDYLNFTAEYTAWSGKKFLNTLKTVVEDIDKRQNRIINSDEYDKLQHEVLKLNPKKVDGPTSDPTISTRKSINLLVKLGFVNTGLSSYHRQAKEYYETFTDRNRQIIFSKIVHESSSLSSSVKEYDPRKHINFLIETLIRAENFLTKDDLIAFFTVDPLEYEDGYIKLEDLRKIDTPENLKEFFRRKYNQVNHFCLVLANMSDLMWHEDIIGFKEDIRKKYQKEIDNKDRKRSSYQDAKTKEYLEEKNKQITGSTKICMVTNIEYPTLISSHIKRSELCSHNEKYDPNVVILVSPEINELLDKGDISFNDGGKIIFANNINQILQQKLKNLCLNAKFLTEGRKLYLKWNRENWFNKQNRHK